MYNYDALTDELTNDCYYCFDTYEVCYCDDAVNEILAEDALLLIEEENTADLPF